MSEQRRSTVSVHPEVDDFAARYDRMIMPGAGTWVIKIVIGLGVLLVVWALAANLL